MLGRRDRGDGARVGEEQPTVSEDRSLPPVLVALIAVPHVGGGMASRVREGRGHESDLLNQSAV